jgi:hypothetical protein
MVGTSDFTINKREATPMDYTEKQIERLREVFTLVQDQSNWKNPIDSVIPSGPATPFEIHDAVIFFTGSVPTIEHCTMYGYAHPTALVRVRIPALRVTAIGYYLAIGA